MISSINELKFADLLGNLTSLCGPKIAWKCLAYWFIDIHYKFPAIQLCIYYYIFIHYRARNYVDITCKIEPEFSFTNVCHYHEI
jgi:hypothetical protein